MTLRRLNKNYEGGRSTSRKIKGEMISNTSHYPIDKIGSLNLGNASTSSILNKARGSISVLPQIDRKMPKKKFKRSLQETAHHVITNSQTIDLGHNERILNPNISGDNVPAMTITE